MELPSRNALAISCHHLRLCDLLRKQLLVTITTMLWLHIFMRSVFFIVRYRSSDLHRRLGEEMSSYKFLTGRGRERLTLKEQTLLEDSSSSVQMVEPRKTLIRRGEPVCSSMLVVEGFVCRSADDHRGRRQIISLYIPGDFVDLDGLKLKRLDNNVVAIGAAKVAAYSHDTLANLSKRCPRLAEVVLA